MLTVLTNRDSSDRHVLGNRGESWLGRKSCSCLAKKHFDANYCGEPWWGEVGTSCKVKYCHPTQGSSFETQKTLTPSSLDTNSTSVSSSKHMCTLHSSLYSSIPACKVDFPLSSSASPLSVQQAVGCWFLFHVSNDNILFCLFSTSSLSNDS